MFEFNTGQTFDAYFTEQELLNVEARLDPYVVHKSGEWFASDPWGNQTDVETTLFVLRSYEILGVADAKVSYPDLNAYVSRRLSDISLPSPEASETIGNILPLVEAVNYQQSGEFYSWAQANLPAVQSLVKATMQDITSTSTANSTRVKFLVEALGLNFEIVYADLPVEIHPGIEKVFEFSASSLGTVLTKDELEGLRVSCGTDVFSQWTTGSPLGVSCVPSFDPATPWETTMTLSYDRGEPKAIDFPVSFTSLGTITSQVEELANSYRFTATVDACTDVIDNAAWSLVLSENTTAGDFQTLFEVENSHTVVGLGGGLSQLVVEGSVEKSNLPKTTNEYQFGATFEQDYFPVQQRAFTFDFGVYSETLQEQDTNDTTTTQNATGTDGTDGTNSTTGGKTGGETQEMQTPEIVIYPVVAVAATTGIVVQKSNKTKKDKNLLEAESAAAKNRS